MARSAGVTVIAVFAAVGSLLCFAMGCLMAVALVVGLPKQSIDTTPQAVAKLGMIMAIIVFLVPAIWGGVSSIGLFRMKPWARVSTLIFAGLLAFFGVVSPIFILMIPMPATPGADPAVMAAVKVGITVFYLMLAAVGVWWLAYLTRPRVKALFEPAGSTPATEFGMAVTPSGPQRPLSVSIIAWFLIIGAAFLPLNAILRMPALMFGAVLTGWKATLLMLLFALISVTAGVGLLRLRLYGQRLAIAYFVLGILNATTGYLVPGSAARLARVMDAMPAAFRSPNPPPINFVALSALGAVIALIPLYFLIKNRGAFEPSQAMLPPGASV